MHWWDLNPKSFLQFPSKKNLLTCIGGTSSQNRFADFLVVLVIIDMHWWDLNKKRLASFRLIEVLVDIYWWDLNTKPFHRVSAKRNTYWHALVGL